MVGYFPWLAAGFMAEKGQSPKTLKGFVEQSQRPPHQGEIPAMMAFCSIEEFCMVGVKSEAGGGSLSATT